MKKIYTFSALLSICTVVAEKNSLVSITDINPHIMIESSRSPRACYVRKRVAKQLSWVQKTLEEINLGLKVYEGYCSECEDECIETSDGCMVDLPEECNRHCRGTSVDVTLVDAQGMELEMPCMFDDFCKKAKPSFANLPDHIIANRTLLRDIMMSNGFIPSENAWWHFDIKGWQNYSRISSSLYDEIDQE